MKMIDQKEFEHIKKVGHENNVMLKEIRTAIVGDKALGIDGLVQRLDYNREQDLERHEALDVRIEEIEVFVAEQKITNKLAAKVVAGIVALAGLLAAFWEQLKSIFGK